MADSGNKLGDAYVELRLRMDKLEADAAQAKPIIEKIAKEQEKIANNTEQSAKAAGGWAASLNGVWNTWNSILNTMQSAMHVGIQIGEVFTINTTKAQQFANAIAAGTGRAASVSSQQAQSALQIQLGDMEDNSTMGGILDQIMPLYRPFMRRKIRADLAVLQSGDEANRVKALRELNAPYLNADFSSAVDAGISGASAGAGFGGDAVQLLRDIRNTSRWNPPAR